MKNGLDRKDGAEPEPPSNVVSFKSARDRAEKAAKKRAASEGESGRPGISIGQWIVGGFFMLMAIGGAIALVRPLVKGAGIASGWGIV